MLELLAIKCSPFMEMMNLSILLSVLENAEQFQFKLRQAFCTNRFNACSVLLHEGLKGGEKHHYA